MRCRQTESNTKIWLCPCQSLYVPHGTTCTSLSPNTGSYSMLTKDSRVEKRLLDWNPIRLVGFKREAPLKGDLNHDRRKARPCSRSKRGREMFGQPPPTHTSNTVFIPPTTKGAFPSLLLRELAQLIRLQRQIQGLSAS